MEVPTAFSKKAKHAQAYVSRKLSCFAMRIWCLPRRSVEFIVFHGDPFLVQLCYFIIMSLAGFIALKMLKQKPEAARPKNLDLLFTSFSAATVSSMATVEMEAFSESQLLVLALLMLFGGEVFTSMLGLPFTKARLRRERSTNARADSSVDINIELPAAPTEAEAKGGGSFATPSQVRYTDAEQLKDDALTCLSYVVLGYIFVINFGGFLFTSLYLTLVSEARQVLRSKGLRIPLFAVFVSVSSFGNCGFTPNNENMVVFKKDSALLLLVIAIILSGNTLFPSCLRCFIWLLKKVTKKEEFTYILQYSEAIGYNHLFPHMHCIYLASTVAGFILVQLLLLCYQDWNSEIFQGMYPFQKGVGALFESVNSRHAGESIFDISKLSPAIWVLYVVMMYLPPYTYFVPDKRDGWPSTKTRGKRMFPRTLNLSLLCYPIIFIILVCIIERKSFLEDPLNFSIFNVVFEVISAHGNVGFSIGYSCDRLVKPDGSCKDASYGFVGRWSNKGKVIIIVVMLLGRLKKFQMKGEKAWKFG